MSVAAPHRRLLQSAASSTCTAPGSLTAIFASSTCTPPATCMCIGILCVSVMYGYTHGTVHRRHRAMEVGDACLMPLPLGHRLGCGEAQLQGGVAGEAPPCGAGLLAPLQYLPQDQASQCVHQCSPSVSGRLLHRVARHHSAQGSLLHSVAGHRMVCVSIPHVLSICDHPVRGSLWPVVSWSRGTISSMSHSPSGPPLRGFLNCRKVTNSPSG